MAGNAQRSREAGWLFVLFALYLAGTLFFEQRAQQATTTAAPSSFNAKSSGVKAYYLLLEKQGYAVSRLRTTWNALTANDGMLVITEPLDEKRPVGANEQQTLKRWVEAGGTIFYTFAPPTHPADDSAVVFGAVAVTQGSKEAQTAKPEPGSSPYLENVQMLSYQSEVRLKTAERDGYKILVKDRDGGLLLHKPLGKGHLIVSAMGDLVSNAAIENSDNVLLAANIAGVTVGGNHKTIAFDEYHHGVGFASAETTSAEGVWAITPLSVRLACYGLIALGILFLYNGNRYFGALHPAPLQEYRASTDYVGSVAGLLHRAKAADVAMASLYTKFVRDLRRNLDVSPEKSPEVLAGEAQKRYSVSAPQLQHCLLRSQAAAEGQRISEAEMVELAQQIEYFRRVCHLV